eukprot:CAMPEP_0197197024 /NCGR_PEP_ID=MMETSP1423-20130617/32656_1 /TAXON_ID=476441 /ORGANISM="Pseudo-nitzschia heimii, Strain UNC1101" /LENGTH=1102 /DNA_ID=CAMNT_0042650839 /DNA_START=109 /DNA_END=3418 /DNA_ORIENTATION=-
MSAFAYRRLSVVVVAVWWWFGWNFSQQLLRLPLADAAAMTTTTTPASGTLAGATATAEEESAVLSMEKGSTLLIKLEAVYDDESPREKQQPPEAARVAEEEEEEEEPAADDDDEGDDDESVVPEEEEEEEEPAADDDDEGDNDESVVVVVEPAFPGIYTVRYTYHRAVVPPSGESSVFPRAGVVGVSGDDNGAFDRLLRELDAIRVDCDDGETDDAGCRGQFLIRTEDAYREILAGGGAAAAEPDGGSETEEEDVNERRGGDDDGGTRESSSSSSTDDRPRLHSLEFDPALTERWVRPRMRVAAESADRAKRHRGLRLRSTWDVPEGKNLSLGRGGGYSTIPLYECYYDYQGMMDWIKDFMARCVDSSILEVTWTDIGDSWEKTKSSDGGGGGYDIYALTITGKAPAEPAPGASDVPVGESDANRNRQHKEIERDSARESQFLFGKGRNDENPDDADESSSSSSDPGKAPFLIVSATHAREYTPPILVKLWLERLLEKVEAGDADFLSMLEQTEIHWIPYLNPDGRIVAETEEPLRRKNMNDEWTGNVDDSLVCPADAFGVDLNRNLPYEWGNDEGSSDKPCSYDSRGSGPGSEPETQALVRYATRIFPAPQRRSSALNSAGTDYNVAHTPGLSMDGESSRRWKGYDPLTTRGVFADIHSYGRVYIYPWGNANAVSPNDAAFRSAMGHVESMTGNAALGPGPNHYGAASGATDDWAYGVLGAFSMTWELGSEFHEPCEDFARDAPKHFGAFEYLAKLAPFPFALGVGPITTGVEGLPGTLALYYRSIDDEMEEEEELALLQPLLPDGNVTIQNDALLAAARRIVRMGTNTAHDLGRNLVIGVTVKLPEVIPSDEDPIDFEDDDDGRPHHHHSRREDPSSIAVVRVFFRGAHPLVGIESVELITTGRGGEYWEVDVSGDDDDDEEGTTSDDDGSRSYEISVPIDEVWKAFGVESRCPEDVDVEDDVDVTTATERTLYFQAVDDVGNPGPVTARKITVMVRPEAEDDDDDDDDFFGALLAGDGATGPPPSVVVAPVVPPEPTIAREPNSNLIRTAAQAAVDCAQEKSSSGGASSSSSGHRSLVVVAAAASVAGFLGSLAVTASW